MGIEELLAYKTQLHGGKIINWKVASWPMSVLPAKIKKILIWESQVFTTLSNFTHYDYHLKVRPKEIIQAEWKYNAKNCVKTSIASKQNKGDSSWLGYITFVLSSQPVKIHLEDDTDIFNWNLQNALIYILGPF